MTWQTTVHDIRTWAFMGACDITPKDQAFPNLGRGCNNRFGEGNGCIRTLLLYNVVATRLNCFLVELCCS